MCLLFTSCHSSIKLLLKSNKFHVWVGDRKFLKANNIVINDIQLSTQPFFKNRLYSAILYVLTKEDKTNTVDLTMQCNHSSNLPGRAGTGPGQVGRWTSNLSNKMNMGRKWCQRDDYKVRLLFPLLWCLFLSSEGTVVRGTSRGKGQVSNGCCKVLRYLS